MNLIAAIVAAIFGFVLFHGVGGAVIGAVLVYLFFELARLQRRLEVLEQRGAPALRSAEPIATVSVAPSPPLEPEPESQASDVVVPFTTIETEETSNTDTASAAVASEPLLPQWLTRFFTDGNWAVRAGVVILFFGVAFLLKYAAEHTRVPIELRLAGVGIGAMVLLVLGWRLRQRRAAYAVMLQGGAVGILYLNLFAALRLYQLIPASAAFAMLAAVAAFSAALAVMQNARSLAMLGMAGGFLAPILTATSSGNHVMLFSYYALLNAGIVVIAWYRAWRELNLLGFVFTFVIGAAWGYLTYRPEYFASTEPFLILFFLFYVAIAILFTLGRPSDDRGYIDGTLVFGAPIVAFAMQAALVKPFVHGLGFSAMTLAAFYLALGGVLLRHHARSRFIVEAFLALGVIFLTLVFPLMLDGHWTAATWVVEGAGLLWIGVRQARRLPRAFGVLLQLGAALVFAWTALFEDGTTATVPIANHLFVGALLIVLATLFSSFQLERNAHALKGAEKKFFAYLLFAAGLLWWWYAIASEVARDVSVTQRNAVEICAFAASAIFATLLARRLDWRWLYTPALLLLPLMYRATLTAWADFGHVFAHAGFIAWAIGVISYLWILRQSERDNVAASWLHALWLWLVVLVLASELAWLANEWTQTRAWPVAAWMMAVILAWQTVLLLSATTRWPVAALRTTYLGLGVAPLVALLILASLHSHTLADVAPLQYMPFLNPLDLVHALFIAVAVQWWLALREDLNATARAQLLWVIGAVAFLWLNATLLRTLHHWGGVDYRYAALKASVLVQAALSIFWTLCALVAMFVGRRWQLRPLWVIGAGLLAIVIAKLFLVDLSDTGGVARIVSFIGVGVLLLLIGYVAPVPPHVTSDTLEGAKE